MKHSFLSVLAISTLLFAYSCSKSDKPEEKEIDKPLVTVPDAAPVHDGKSGGVYKGVIIGSTGTVKIILQGNTVSAEVTIDGKTKVMTPQNLPVGWTSGQSLEDIVFAADNWTLTFSVSANGDEPYVSAVSIPGHTNVAVCIVKERSTTLAKVFEGSFGEADTAFVGTMNFLITSENDRDTVLGIIQKQVTGLNQFLFGKYGNNDGKESLSIFGVFYNEGTIFRASGELKDDEIEGGWKAYYGFNNSPPFDSGYWKAKRTL